ncbi:hypothetical protein [Synechococcus phage BUCT-ZZ01]|nr:hypothetical protein [Synechococcus phage BUCT-ZZ01]
MLIIDYDAEKGSRVKMVKDWNFVNKMSTRYTKGIEKKFMENNVPALNGQKFALHDLAFSCNQRIIEKARRVMQNEH